MNMKMTNVEFVKKLEESNWEGKLLPSGIEVTRTNGTTGLVLSGTPVKSLPPKMKVQGELNLKDCHDLESIGEGLVVGWEFNCSGCGKLKSLPEKIKIGVEWNGYKIYNLQNSGLTKLPAKLAANVLRVEGCRLVLSKGAKAEILYADNEVEAEKGFRVDCAMHIENITFTGAESTKMLMRSVSIKEMRRMNAEKRRMVVRRMGYGWLVREVSPAIIDMDDHIHNGQRALLKLSAEIFDNGYEPYNLLCCGDPSTGRVYYMEVPGNTKTCQDADAYLNHGLDQKRQVGRT